MSVIKRFGLTLLLFLFLLSIIHDLNQSSDVKIEHEHNSPIEAEGIKEVAHIKVMPGDTVLSITEEINNIENLNIEKIKRDFSHLNPGMEMDAIPPYSFYYFPVYNGSS